MTGEPSKPQRASRIPRRKVARIEGCLTATDAMGGNMKCPMCGSAAAGQGV
jgi:hypothetical protein